MSNCPSLEILINNYNRYYGNMTTDCGEYGCCPGINLDCDNAIRKSITNGNNQETIDLFLNHKEYKPILINKEDPEGSNCITPSSFKPNQPRTNNLVLFELIKSYNNYYPGGEDDYGWIILLVIIGIILVCLGNN